MSTPIVWQNDLVYIEVEQHFNPWLKIIVKRKVKEFSFCTTDEKQCIWQLLDDIEKAMLGYYKCDKINIASFGNMLPQVHFHIMARFKQDGYFPEPVWGKQQREPHIILPSFDGFIAVVLQKISNNT
jgi:diadenosine tetraphosphate (Ap4A) HIT family hydrolase